MVVMLLLLLICFAVALLAVVIPSTMLRLWLEPDRISEPTSFRASSIVVEDGERLLEVRNDRHGRQNQTDANRCRHAKRDDLNSGKDHDQRLESPITLMSCFTKASASFSEASFLGAHVCK